MKRSVSRTERNDMSRLELKHGKITKVSRRKVVQIATNIDSVGRYFILAVCDDGTLWQLNGLYEADASWKPFPTPPPSTEVI